MTPPRGAVLVTGASTGIGRAVVEKLVAHDIPVLAGVRSLDDALDHPRVTPVRLDVTSPTDIEAAAEQAASLPSGVAGLVNNAGIAVGGPIEVTPLEDFRRQFEVNLFAQVAVTQAFIPLLRRHGGGRIVFTGSMSGLVGLPFVGPYAASKHALHGMAQSLRHELRPWGIRVSVLAPGTIDTPIWQKAEQDLEGVGDLPAEARALYADQIRAGEKAVAQAKRTGIPAEKVADAAYHALTARRPKARYLVGNDARLLHALSSMMPAPVMDRLVASQFKA